MRGKEEADAGREGIHIHTGIDRSLNIGNAITEGERDLLSGAGASFADVISAYRNGVPHRQVFGTIRKRIRHQSHTRLRRIDIGAAGGIFLEDIVLDSTAELGCICAALLCNNLVHEQEHRGRCVDCHRGGDALLIDGIEQNAHVVQRAYRHPYATDFAERTRIIGIQTELGRQIEGDTQSGNTTLQQQLVATITILGAAETSVLAHGPAATAVHSRVDTAGERIFSG